ncbi:MAG: DtxR family transcriptional regulator [Deltaproteobacteria bacterium CG03_land_8_20_14_0_80_45_14]|nr:MAG: DtxR family transcriptional regulator [Deltaproteobacteria bacterium CG03_land_8_20_14_0_80_45_14]
MEALTPSLEDYLEAIWTISLREKVARVKDIAKCLAVTTPSVVSALNVLLEKNLIKHESYGYIELTDQGALKAKEVDEHHKLLFTLLNEIFGINAGIASKDACKIEHHLSKETVKRIEQFIQFLQEHQEEKTFFTSRFKGFVEKGEEDMGDKKESKADFTLRDLKPGEKGKVVKIKGKGNLKKRLLDMGIVPGTEIQLEKVAPLGDPIDILIKGYHLSLRKDEAKDILITRS